MPKIRPADHLCRDRTGHRQRPFRRQTNMAHQITHRLRQGQIGPGQRTIGQCQPPRTAQDLPITQSEGVLRAARHGHAIRHKIKPLGPRRAGDLQRVPRDMLAIGDQPGGDVRG